MAPSVERWDGVVKYDNQCTECETLRLNALRVRDGSGQVTWEVMKTAYRRMEDRSRGVKRSGVRREAGDKKRVPESCIQCTNAGRKTRW
jgi:predicted DCC family thiol-disulfide oxidoreductase YuxK